jgi:alpha-L-fucosidase
MPAEIKITSHQPAKRAKVTLLGASKKLKWKSDGEGFVVTIPDELRNNPPSKFAWTLKVSSVK